MKEKRRVLQGRRLGEGIDASARGLLLLIAGALLLSGLLEMIPRGRNRPTDDTIVFRYEDVHVLSPTFVTHLCIDVNDASAEELTGLPGIGPALASRIVDFREEHGPFASIDDLEKVSGIGPATVEGFRDRACIESEGSSR